MKNYAKWLVLSVSTKYEYKDEVVWGSLKLKAVTSYGQNDNMLSIQSVSIKYTDEAVLAALEQVSVKNSAQ